MNFKAHYNYLVKINYFCSPKLEPKEEVIIGVPYHIETMDGQFENCAIKS